MQWRLSAVFLAEVKIQADICNKRQAYFEEMMDAVLNRRRENDSDEQV